MLRHPQEPRSSARDEYSRLFKWRDARLTSLATSSAVVVLGSRRCWARSALDCWLTTSAASNAPPAPTTRRLVLDRFHVGHVGVEVALNPIHDHRTAHRRGRTRPGIPLATAGFDVVDPHQPGDAAPGHPMRTAQQLLVDPRSAVVAEPGVMRISSTRARFSA
jgi:hypothetical protein